jgi:cell division protease FtsH
MDRVLLGEVRDAVLSDDDRRRVAVHEAGHALVAAASPCAPAPRRISIIPRGMSLGATQQTPEDDRYLIARSELEARLQILLAGRSAEQLVLGEVSTGAEDDLRKATQLATRMVAHWGMSDSVGPVYHELSHEQPFLGRRVATESAVSDSSTHAVEEQARQLLLEARDAAETIIADHLDTLHTLVEALCEHETLDELQLANLLDPLIDGPGEDRSDTDRDQQPSSGPRSAAATGVSVREVTLSR